MKQKKIWVTTFIITFIVLVSVGSQSQLDSKKYFHTKEERDFFAGKIMSPIGPGEYFQLSTSCLGCHGPDSAGIANINEDGEDINLYDRWQSTMMANSARDPFWRAKVSHEILVNPAHANELQNKCTECHAPMGRYTALYHGIPNYGLIDLAADSLGADGVSCASCHTIDPSVGSTYSGAIPYDTTRNIYGPFQNPVQGPMQLYEGYTPLYSPHMNEARVCASCHTLISQSVDLNGNFTGGEFVEQATYHEYLNSHFPADTITCQTCHMPHLDDAIIIANGQAALQPRYPFNQHMFVGANSFMLTMIKNNKAQLGATADDWKFDSTIAATNVLLRERSIAFDLQLDSSANDTGYFKVRIENKAGHKFPSGYPARRAVVQFIVIDALGDTVFKSGTFTNDFRVSGEVPSFEPHHDIISQSNIPQIYEIVMGDVNNNFTSVLERSAVLLKDNRIPPGGFTTTHNSYDTVKISNDALADADFNKVNAVEGSGVDIVHYRIPYATASGNVSIYARVYYQAVPPKFVDELLAYNSAEIDSFRNMFNNADQTPLLIASDSIINIGLNIPSANLQFPDDDIILYPAVSADGKIVISSLTKAGLKEITVFSNEGKKVSGLTITNSPLSLPFNLPPAAGIYYLKITTNSSKVYLKRAFRL
ncbi:MAG TPA: T9SS type A sorting domain-containing protein [Bacteroidia bacterium]|nr:T9SS type A sorting domain-containing protein [Bacteroidia bacterium]